MKFNMKFSARFLSMLLALIMTLSLSVAGFSTVSAVDLQVAETSADTKTVYLSINGQWTQKLCAVYTWGDDYNSGNWVAMKNQDSVNDLWSVDIPADYNNITFCSRVAPNFGWDSVKNQTGQLSIPEGCDHFTLTGESSGVWDLYGSENETPVGTRIIYFAPNTEWMEIQGAEGHNFVARAYNTTSDSTGVYLDMTLVQGSYGVHPAIWSVEVSESYTKIEFYRGEGLYADGTWKLWESTSSFTIPSANNLLTQDEALYQAGEWSYIDAPVATEPEETEPEATEPEVTEPEATEPDTDPVETKSVYFTPNDTWKTAVSASGAFSAYSFADSQDMGTWVWLVAESDGRYRADIPVSDSNIIFAISYSTEPDAVWNQTANLSIPDDSNHFTQDSNDFTTGTWYAVAGTTYYVVFLDIDGRLLSAQIVSEGESAEAPEVPAKTGYVFKGWDKDFSDVTENLTVTAVYEKDETSIPVATTGLLKIEVAGGTGFTISFNDSAARPQGTSYTNTKAPIGATVTITANEVDGVEFMGWYNPYNGTAYTKDYSYTFTTSGNDFIKAMYKVDVAGVNTVIFLNDKAGGGMGKVIDMQYYAAGEDIVVPADPTQVGFDFVGWSVTVEEIKAAVAAGEDVTVVALWELQKVYVSVDAIGCTATGSTNAEGKFQANTAVTFTADEAPAGKKFAYWTVDGVVKGYDETFKCFPSQDCTVEAVFVDETASIEYEVLVNVDTIDTVSVEGMVVFYYSWYVPVEEMDITFVKAGILGVNKDNYTGTNLYVGTTDSNVYDRGPTGANLKPVNSYTWTKSKVDAGQTWVAVAYVQYRTADGELITVYSDLAEATK